MNVKKEDQKKMAFQTEHRLYEFITIPFGLMMYDVFGHFIDINMTKISTRGSFSHSDILTTV